MLAIAANSAVHDSDFKWTLGNTRIQGMAIFLFSKTRIEVPWALRKIGTH